MNSNHTPINSYDLEEDTIWFDSEHAKQEIGKATILNGEKK